MTIRVTKFTCESYTLRVNKIFLKNNFFVLGGTNTGVMKHVGEAVRQTKVVGVASSDINVIGVATWGIVDRAADLISEVCPS